MAAGLDAVKTEIARQFGAPHIEEEQDTVNTKTIKLRFPVNGRDMVVIVSHEFDSDYPKTSQHVDLGNLGRILRESKTGKVAVRGTGIVAI